MPPRGQDPLDEEIKLCILCGSFRDVNRLETHIKPGTLLQGFKSLQSSLVISLVQFMKLNNGVIFLDAKFSRVLNHMN